MEWLIKKVTAQVVSAATLDEEQVSALRYLLAQKTGKMVEVALTVDPSLIGGLWVSVDGYLIDNTVRKQLLDMSASLKKGGAI